MLRFEVAAVVLLVLVALSLLIDRKPTYRVARWCGVGVPMAILLSHASLERYHWQLWPTFFAIALLGCALILPMNSWRVRALALAAMACLVGSCGVASILPLFSIPEATGPYRTGTAVFRVVDDTRRETHTAAVKPRELNIQIWYPTDASAGKRAPYRRRSETTLLASYQAGIPTPSIENGPVKPGRHPVILFNHAWNGVRTQDTFLTVDLASHGFVVVAVDHPYNALRTAFPDGRLILANSDELDDFMREPMSTLLSRANAELQIQAADDSFVLDTLAQWNRDPATPFHDALDLFRVGVMGHSFGGSVAVQAAISDRRILSAVNMDGWTFGDFNRVGLNKPLLQMSDDEPFPGPAELASSDPKVHGNACFDGIMLAGLQRSFSQYGGSLLTIRGSKHMDFSDRPLYSPWRRLTSAGARPWAATAADIRRYTLAFFQRTLLGEKTSLASLENSRDGSTELIEWQSGATGKVIFQAALASCDDVLHDASNTGPISAK